ncbi:MAG: protein kinase [Elusimicrobiota bacterium]
MMRRFMWLTLGMSLLVPRPATADTCTGQVVNGVATAYECNSKVKKPDSQEPDVPPPNISISGNNMLLGGILSGIGNQRPPAPPPPDKPSSGEAGNKESARNQKGASGAAMGAAEAVNASGPISPAAAAQSGTSQEKQAMGSTGASANAFSNSAGDKFLAGNQPQDAARNYERVLASDPNNTAALTGEVQALNALGRKDDAVTAAKRLFALDPSNPVAKGAIGEAKAESTASKFKKLTDAFLHGQTAETLPDRNEGSGATGRGDGAPFGTPSNVRAGEAPWGAQPAAGGGEGAPLAFGPLVLKALRKRAVGDYTGALVDVSQEIDSNPNNAAAWTLRAELDLQLSNYPAGITDSTHALDIAPDNPRALRARSYGEYETRLYQQALADASRAVALDPKNGLGFLYKAMAEDKLGLSDAAAADLNQALALDPTLKRLAAPLLKKFNLGGDASGTSAFRLKPWMVRGGFVGLAMLLVFIGLIGTQKARTMRAVRLTPRREQTDAPRAPIELAPGSVLEGNYRIIREIGRGGMGVVYEALDQSLQRRVAVKRLLQDSQTLPEDLERFLREARLVAQLKHPNLARIYAVAVEREPFLIFELVDGETLDAVLTRNVVLTTAAARKTVGEIASALSYAHAHNIIHRDLKPSNVMIQKDGAAKVMDFGIAHQSRTTATQLTQTVACGTPPYMAPEQAMGSVSKASDVYALGVMTYELLAGKRPFEGPNYLNQKLEARFAPATSVNRELPAGLDRFFASALDPDPRKRPAGAEAFMEAFARACDATPRRQASNA